MKKQLFWDIFWLRIILGYFGSWNGFWAKQEMGGVGQNFWSFGNLFSIGRKPMVYATIIFVNIHFWSFLSMGLIFEYFCVDICVWYFCSVFLFAITGYCFFLRFWIYLIFVYIWIININCSGTTGRINRSVDLFW